MADASQDLASNLPPEIATAIAQLDEALAPVIPVVAEKLGAGFPQQDPTERYAAMRVHIHLEWPDIKSRVPIFEHIDLPALTARRENEPIDDCARRCFAMLCFVAGIAAAFEASPVGG